MRHAVMLSGKEHEVLTAIAVLDGQRCESRVVRSLVRFRPISREEAAAYWASGEPGTRPAVMAFRARRGVCRRAQWQLFGGGRAAGLRNRRTVGPFRHTLLANLNAQ